MPRRPRASRASIPSYPVELVRDGGLAAIASRVDLAEFGEEALAERARSSTGSRRAALAHEEVLERALQGGRSLLPFRFGTIYLDTEQVGALLRERSSELSGGLERVRDRLELGVRGALDPARAEAALLESDPDLAPLAAELAGSSSGAAYMRRKQLERELACRGRSPRRGARGRGPRAAGGGRRQSAQQPAASSARTG